MGDDFKEAFRDAFSQFWRYVSSLDPQSQAEFADAAGISKGTFSKWINDGVKAEPETQPLLRAMRQAGRDLGTRRSDWLRIFHNCMAPAILWGILFYDRDEEDIFDVSGYRDTARTGLPTDTASWIRTIGSADRHGGRFRYVSLVTDVLGWVLERAAGAPLSALISREIWSRVGAELDANIIVDARGFPVAEGGISATLRDVGRFGQMCLDQGVMILCCDVNVSLLDTCQQ